jgi:hypothetical protein
MIDIATQKTQDIKAAYELLKNNQVKVWAWKLSRLGTLLSFDPLISRKRDNSKSTQRQFNFHFLRPNLPIEYLQLHCKAATRGPYYRIHLSAQSQKRKSWNLGKKRDSGQLDRN